VKGVARRVDGAIDTLTPVHLALVMAAGIASVGMRLRSLTAPARPMLVVCAAAFVALVAVAACGHVRRDVLAARSAA